jgi:hypothetical protein
MNVPLPSFLKCKNAQNKSFLYINLQNTSLFHFSILKIIMALLTNRPGRKECENLNVSGFLNVGYFNSSY